MTPEQLARSGSESAHQAAFFCWCGLNQNNYPELRWCFAIPNGGARHYVTAARLKVEGVKAGVWDIFLPVPITPFRGLWIEMKKPGRKLSDLQKEFGEFVMKQGYRCEVCHGWEAAVKVIEDYLNGQ